MNWEYFLGLLDHFEFVGLIAMLLVSASLCMKNIKTLRIVNLAGSLVFIGYSLFITISLSVLLLNAFTVMVNAYYLLQMKFETTRVDLFDVLFIDTIEDDTLRRFIRFHSEDITRFNPSFNPDFKTGTLVGAEYCFILRETLPVSLVAYKRGKDDEIVILLDYVVPAFRDFRNAKFFFSHVVNRIAVPGSVFVARGEVKAHSRYLKRMGFIETGREDKTICFRKAV
ncbi:hypothetical protein AGMMS50230_17050 [Spirochaetia bacterium]|nr:hypothetical protein AGMMS50230_17050 [Spirochaetia bacterium]